MKKNRFDIDWEGVLFVISWLVVMAIVMFSMAGCSSMKEYRESVRTDTVYKARVEVRVDSVWVDRYRNVYVSGDTVYNTLTEYKEKYVYLDKVDTVWKIDVRRDVEYVEKSVARERSGYDKFCSWSFWIMVVVVIVYLAYRIVKWWISR